MKRIIIFLSFILASLLLCGCKDNSIEPIYDEVITVSLNNSDIYKYPTVGGDEEGAIISKQAYHYEISEIRRNRETNYAAVYVYKPVAGYLGEDSVNIKIMSGSDGAGPAKRITIIKINFIITT